MLEEGNWTNMASQSSDLMVLVPHTRSQVISSYRDLALTDGDTVARTGNQGVLALPPAIDQSVTVEDASMAVAIPQDMSVVPAEAGKFLVFVFIETFIE